MLHGRFFALAMAENPDEAIGSQTKHQNIVRKQAEVLKARHPLKRLFFPIPTPRLMRLQRPVSAQVSIVTLAFRHGPYWTHQTGW
jgi:hypothetical protein